LPTTFAKKNIMADEKRKSSDSGEVEHNYPNPKSQEVSEVSSHESSHLEQKPNHSWSLLDTSHST
jgi:hypothetical protein